MVGYSFLVGDIDFGWPVKVAFFSALVLLLVLAIMDFNTEYKNRGTDLSGLGLSGFRLAGELISFVSLLALGAIFLQKPISSVNLTSLGWEVRIVVLIGIGLSVAFSWFVISDLRNLRRKGAVPPILTPSKEVNEDKKEAKEDLKET